MKIFVNTTKLTKLTSTSLIITEYDTVNKTKTLEKDDAVSMLNSVCFSEAGLGLMQ